MRKKAPLLLVVLALGAPALQASSPRERMVASLLSQVPKLMAEAPAEPARISVYGIECADPAFDANAFQDQLVAAIVDAGRFKVVDRKSLSVLLDEMELALSGLVDDTGEMVRAGRLVGVQGFWFGSLEFGADRAVLALKLVDVESGAIVFSRRLSATDPAFVRLGGGVDYTFVPLDLGGDGTVDAVNHAVGFDFAYRQGFEAWRRGFVGAELVMYRAFSEDPAQVVSCAALKARLFFRLADAPGFTIAPYLGGAAEMLLYGSDATEPTALAAYPLAGIDLEPTPSISIFAEAGWRPGSVPLRQGSDARLPGGFAATAGLAFLVGLR